VSVAAEATAGIHWRYRRKRKRALLGSNPPRNSRSETHGDAAGADGRCSLASLFWRWLDIGHHRRFPHPLKTHRGERPGDAVTPLRPPTPPTQSLPLA
jgi:hypothetical protein